MKYRIIPAALLAAAAIFSVAYSQAGFQDVLDIPAIKSPLAAKTLYNGIVLAGKRLVGVGQRGHIVYSDDQGASWNQVATPVSSDFTAISFPTPQQGWVVGHDGVVLHSSDGGATWSKQLDGRAMTEIIKRYYAEHAPTDAALAEEIKSHITKGPDKSLLSVWFENENSGFVLGAFNLILHTSDGGKSWEPLMHRTENPKSLHFYAINSVGQDLFVCGEQGMVLKLDKQSGKFMALKTGYNGTFFGVTGNTGAVIAHGMRGNVFRSKDGGTSWKKIETGLPVGLTGSVVTADGTIILLSQAGHLLVSRDNGAGFTPVKLERPFPAAAVAALDNQTLMLAGLRGMLKQTLK